MTKWMMPIAAALVLAACNMGGQETESMGSSGDSMGGAASGTSSVETMPGYPTGASSGASDVGSTESSGSSTEAGTSGSAGSPSDGTMTKDKPQQ